MSAQNNAKRWIVILSVTWGVAAFLIAVATYFGVISVGTFKWAFPTGFVLWAVAVTLLTQINQS